MASSQGLVSGTDIPVEHLDFGYIGKCEKASEVESLLKILRSNQEGYYPDLIKCAEARLEELDPKSKLLIKTKEAQRLEDLPASDSRGIKTELEEWELQMNREESTLQDVSAATSNVPANGEVDELPPIRKAGPITKEPASVETADSARGKEDRLGSTDYRGWDKFDVKSECKRVDTEEPAPQGKGAEVKLEATLSEKELQMSAVEKKKLALREKEKGNEAFRAGDHEEALTYYSRSILLEPSAASYNNRAISLIKLQRYQEAIQDCSKVLQLEPTNTKALLRQGTALLEVKDWAGAEKVVQQVLELEPKNKKALEMLSTAQEKIAKSAKSEPKKGRRIQIEEVEEEDEATPSSTTPPEAEPVATPSADVSTPSVPMPAEVVGWKEEGNGLFRKGQYSEAAACYSKAIQRLEPAGGGQDISLSTLLNNRAACHLKNGNSQGCVADCTRSLDLVPVNVKALIRRAQAYEHMEKYRLAYVDNLLALNMDRSMSAVYDANNRISRHLSEQDGPNWRQKLPPHPHQAKVAQVLSQQTSAQAPVPSEATPQSAMPPPALPTSSTTPPTPSITTTSSAADFHTKVTQATTATPSSSATPPHPATPPPEPTPQERFEKAKAKGNEHVRKGQYLEGLNCYSACINACPDRVAGYTNRALCHLKLDSPTSAEKDCSKCLELDPGNIKALYRRALARKAMGKYAESMKDLKHLLELDSENSVAKTEYAAVKQMWEKQLRQLQEMNQKVKGKKPSPAKKKSSSAHKQKASSKDKDKARQQQELAQLLVETKNKVKEMKREDLSYPEKPSEYLNASKTTYYKPTHTQQGSSSAGASRRRKVVVEEEGGEGEEVPVQEDTTRATEDQPTEKADSHKATEEQERGAPKEEEEEGRGQLLETDTRSSEEVVQAVLPEEEEVTVDVTPSLGEDRAESTGKEAEERIVKDAQLSSPYEFLRRWNSISRGGALREYAAVLEDIPPRKLPHIITNKLEGTMLTTIIAVIAKQFLPQKRYQLSWDILENLSKVQRFQTIAMFLGREDKAELLAALSVLEKWEGCSSASIGSLRKTYGVNS